MTRKAHDECDIHTQDIPQAPPSNSSAQQGETTSKLSYEEQDWLEELVARWVETYKKSATTLLLLQLIATGNGYTTAEIAERFIAHSGWHLTERGLYRTLQRLLHNGLLTAEERATPRSGLKHRVFWLSDFGAQYLARIEAAAEQGYVPETLRNAEKPNQAEEQNLPKS